MATCIVCNQQTTPDDVQDGNDVVTLCTRLEKVLDEAIPQGSVMCSSCQFDLAQIEMYYALLVVFKKRYTETKQRTGRNLLQETTYNSSSNLQLGANLEFSPQDIKLEVGSDRTVKECQTDITVPVEAVIKNFVESLSGVSTGMLDSRRKRTPLKRTLLKRTPLKRTPVKKHKRKAASSDSKRRPKRYQYSSESQSEVVERAGPVYREDSESEEYLPDGNSSEATDLDDPVYEPEPSSSKPVVENNLEDSGTEDATKAPSPTPEAEQAPPVKRKRGRPRKIQDPKHIPAPGQKKRVRPKSTREVMGRPFACNLCGKGFPTRPRLKAHVKIHTSDKPFVCSICNKPFRGQGDLNAHMKIHLGDRPFQCDICNKTFPRKNALQRHVVVHSDELPFQCDQCEKRFKGERHLKHHVKAHHSGGRKYLCNICGFAFLTEGVLRNHLKTHNEDKPFKCGSCGRGFSTQAYLSNHELTHQADTREKYLCPICGKALLQKSYLPLHMRQHTGESKYTCGKCGKSFSTSSGYKHHMVIHSGEKPFRCQECGKAFVGKGNLKAHMMSHTDERPHKCSCGQGFRSKVGMLKHMRANKHGACGNGNTGGKSVRPEVPKSRQVPHNMPVPVTTNHPSMEAPPVSYPAQMPVAPHPQLPIAAPLAIAEQYEMMSAYQTGPLYLGL